MPSLGISRIQLTIRRVPGAFPETPITAPMNFLNGEIGTSLSGHGYLITNGGPDPRAEQAIAEAYLTLQPALGSIYFLDPEDCAESLRKGGRNRLPRQVKHRLSHRPGRRGTAPSRDGAAPAHQELARRLCAELPPPR